jgi:hypothetical protein
MSIELKLKENQVLSPPLSMPIMKTKPLLLHPVLLAKVDHTSSFVECCFGITARTMMDESTPATTMKDPILFKTGSKRLPKHTVAQPIQLSSWKAINTIQAFHSTSG